MQVELEGFVAHAWARDRLVPPPEDAGTTHVLFGPRELVEKLAALMPPPRFHAARYHGILGACASGRDRVVPGIGSREGQAVRPTREADGERHRAHPEA